MNRVRGPVDPEEHTRLSLAPADPELRAGDVVAPLDRIRTVPAAFARRRPSVAGIEQASPPPAIRAFPVVDADGRFWVSVQYWRHADLVDHPGARW